ncbi:hypothetical protein KBD13_03365 [Patescibacteria group bacterium]|nr:hypothetical protein [Patescibacteria group bacterium]
MSSYTVVTRSGARVPFDLAMLEQSLQRAAADIGEKDAFAVRSLAEGVAMEVLPLFERASEVVSTDIQAAVVRSLETQHRTDIAQAYQRFHAAAGSEASKRDHEAVPTPSVPVTPPTPTILASQPKLGVVSSVGEAHAPRRRRLSEERKAVTHKFRVADQEGYITVGLYDDGQPGEIFLRMSKEGTMLSGLMDCFATSISLGLQYGVPLKVLARKFMNVQFAPNGPTENPNIPQVQSIIDYVFRWLALKFLTPEERQALVDEAETARVSSLDESIARLSL